jgi:hypothetical protein
VVDSTEHNPASRAGCTQQNRCLVRSRGESPSTSLGKERRTIASLWDYGGRGHVVVSRGASIILRGG